MKVKRLRPAGRSGPTAGSGAARQKQIPSSYSNPTVFKGLESAVRKLDPGYKIKTRPLGDRYTRLAASRRAERPIYTTNNTDGSRKDRPKPAKAPASRRSPPTSSPATPATHTKPRIRRVPKPRNP